jgi:chromatin segregation and condensation protein Rec8/ScpA/Scc1 (kleisin family)
MSLKIALRALLGLVKEAGKKGIEFKEAFPSGAMKIDIIMTFLAMLELLRQGKISVVQNEPLSPIRLYPSDPNLDRGVLESVNIAAS